MVRPASPSTASRPLNRATGIDGPSTTSGGPRRRRGRSLALAAVFVMIAAGCGADEPVTAGPLVTSPTTEAGPPPTSPDPEAFAALGLPAPPPSFGPAVRPSNAPGGATDGAGVSEPLLVSPTTVPHAPGTTIASAEQVLRVEVRTRGRPVDPPGPPTSLPVGPGRGRGPAVLDSETPGDLQAAADPSPSRGPLVFTGFQVLVLLAIAALSTAAGLVLRVVARRRGLPI